MASLTARLRRPRRLPRASQPWLPERRRQLLPRPPSRRRPEPVQAGCSSCEQLPGGAWLACSAPSMPSSCELVKHGLTAQQMMGCWQDCDFLKDASSSQMPESTAGTSQSASLLARLRGVLSQSMQLPGHLHGYGPGLGFSRQAWDYVAWCSSAASMLQSGLKSALNGCLGGR